MPLPLTAAFHAAADDTFAYFAAMMPCRCRFRHTAFDDDTPFRSSLLSPA